MDSSSGLVFSLLISSPVVLSCSSSSLGAHHHREAQGRGLCTTKLTLPETKERREREDSEYHALIYTLWFTPRNSGSRASDLQLIHTNIHRQWEEKKGNACQQHTDSSHPPLLSLFSLLSGCHLLLLWSLPPSCIYPHQLNDTPCYFTAWWWRKRIWEEEQRLSNWKREREKRLSKRKAKGGLATMRMSRMEKTKSVSLSSADKCLQVLKMDFPRTKTTRWGRKNFLKRERETG